VLSGQKALTAFSSPIVRFVRVVGRFRLPVLRCRGQRSQPSF
jgi:hypothetical protein